MLYKLCVDKEYNHFSNVEALTLNVRAVLYGGTVTKGTGTEKLKPHKLYTLLGEAYIEMYATKNLYP